MIRHSLLCTLFSLSIFAVPLVAEASIIDEMNDLASFSGAFGAASVVNNFDGTVTLTKSAGANTDSGVVWNDSGLKIDLANSDVTINPAVANEDFINVTAQYFDAAGIFTNQALVVADTNTDLPINFDVAAGAGVNAESYVLQIRILPFTSESASYTFDSIRAVPEPASLVLVGVGVFAMLRRKKIA